MAKRRGGTHREKGPSVFFKKSETPNQRKDARNEKKNARTPKKKERRGNGTRRQKIQGLAGRSRKAKLSVPTFSKKSQESRIHDGAEKSLY